MLFAVWSTCRSAGNKIKLPVLSAMASYDPQGLEADLNQPSHSLERIKMRMRNIIALSKHPQKEDMRLARLKELHDVAVRLGKKSPMPFRILCAELDQDYRYLSQRPCDDCLRVGGTD